MAGKGDRYRKVDRKKWDAWWDKYEEKRKQEQGEKENESARAPAEVKALRAQINFSLGWLGHKYNYLVSEQHKLEQGEKENESA